MQNDIWYDWTPYVSGPAEVTTAPPTPPCAGEYTTMVIYETDACECPISGTIVGCQTGEGVDCSTAQFQASTDKCYKIRLGGVEGSTPAGTLSVTVDETG